MLINKICPPISVWGSCYQISQNKFFPRMTGGLIGLFFSKKFILANLPNKFKGFTGPATPELNTHVNAYKIAIKSATKTVLAIISGINYQLCASDRFTATKRMSMFVASSFGQVLNLFMENQLSRAFNGVVVFCHPSFFALLSPANFQTILKIYSFWCTF